MGHMAEWITHLSALFWVLYGWSKMDGLNAFSMGEDENAPAGNRTRVASMEGLNDTITLLVPWDPRLQMYALAM